MYYIEFRPLTAFEEQAFSQTALSCWNHLPVVDTSVYLLETSETCKGMISWATNPLTAMLYLNRL